MSFKPLSQSVTNGATAQIPSSDAVFDAIAAIPSPYPSQTGNVNKVLVTDGTSTSWQFAGLGAGSLGTNNMVLGKGLPTGLVGTNNIIIGQGTTGDSITNQSNAILIGNNSPGGNQDANCIRIGHSTAGGFTNGVTIGNSAVGGGSSVSIGNSASSNNGCVVIGANASSSASDRTIVIGSFAASAGGGSVNIGSTTFNMETMYLGFGGVAVTSFANFTIMTSRATGTNTSATAGTLTLAGARGTGTGAGGDVIIATAPAGASGSTLNAHVERLRVTATGAVQVPNYILSPQLYDEGTKTGNFTLNFTNGPCQQATINAAGPLVITLSNPVVGGAYLIKLVQGATPGTVTWPLTVKWGAAGVPTLSNTTGKIDIINLYWDGTNYFGTYALGF